ncbi:MAG: DHH family phosphoesterase [Candidatus Thorarchaeota archaeon]
MTVALIESQPIEMQKLIDRAVNAIRNSKKSIAFSHIDADGISALSIVVTMLEREGKHPIWRNVHQLNSETIEMVRHIIHENEPDLVIFSDFGTGQRGLLEQYLEDIEFIENILILDHHLPTGDNITESSNSSKLIEINPCLHGLSGSYDVSGAGVAFLVAYALSRENADLSELAIVGATGDLQDYYGKGFTGINRDIIQLGTEMGYIRVDRDLTFFGINTRPLPFLLEYSTDPFIPGLSGAREECYNFYNELGIQLKTRDDEWRTWVDLSNEDKQLVTQKLFSYILESYDDPRIAQGIIGNVITLIMRPPRTELRSAKEFSTLLNACGRNRRPEVGVKICFGDSEAITEGSSLLQQHRANLAQALRRLETDGYDEQSGMYIVNDPLTPDTIIGIVIGMAQGARIIPIDKPVIGVSTNTSDDESAMVKISGRARKFLVDRGLNLKEAFVEVGASLNEQHGALIVEAGGHPMAAGAFVHTDHLEEFLTQVSSLIEQQLRLKK